MYLSVPSLKWSRIGKFRFWVVNNCNPFATEVLPHIRTHKNTQGMVLQVLQVHILQVFNFPSRVLELFWLPPPQFHHPRQVSAQQSHPHHPPRRQIPHKALHLLLYHTQLGIQLIKNKCASQIWSRHHTQPFLPQLLLKPQKVGEDTLSLRRPDYFTGEAKLRADC